MTSGVAQAECDLQQGLGQEESSTGPWHGALEAQAGHARLSHSTSLPQASLPQGLSPSRRTAYKAIFCRMSNREGMGNLLARLSVDPR